MTFWHWSKAATKFPIIKLINTSVLAGVFFCMCTAHGELVITELLASNHHGLVDEDGDSSDWIEIQNRGKESIDTSGYFLSDSIDTPEKWPLPLITFEPNEIVIVFTSGKDRTAADKGLHTNFKLSRKPGHVVFSKKTDDHVETVQHIHYAEQYPDTSYGLVDASEFRFFGEPTPGSLNATRAYDGVIQPVRASLGSGIYDDPISFRLECLTPGVDIRYTIDGTEPSLQSPSISKLPSAISKNTTIRFRAFKEGWLSPPADIRTFLFPGEILQQSRPETLPLKWADEIPGHYSLDTENPPGGDDGIWANAFRALPTVHLTMDPMDLFDEETGIYMNSLEDGKEWERSVTVELFGTHTDPLVPIDAGIRIQGRSSRKPETTPKHSFRLLFKTDYGPKRWHYPLFGEDAAQSFNTLVLRATSNHSWLYPQADQRVRAQYLRDPWVKMTQRAMGNPSPHTRFVHLFINKLYWGLYCISERPDDHFMADYMGGRPSDYDIRKGGEDQSGSPRGWKNLIALVQTDLSRAENYERLNVLMNMDSFIDYMILNHYIGNETWDYGNWYAGRNRTDGKFHFFAWDTETSMARVKENRVFAFNKDRTTAIFQALRKNADFRNHFNERVQLHCTGDGALMPDEAAKRYMELAGRIELPITLESARWGDYRLNVHPHRIPPYERYTRDEHWMAEKNRLLEHYFPERTQVLLDQYEAIGLYNPSSD